jgi:hypothetical protein
VAGRFVTVRYPWMNPDSPEKQRRDGVILTLFTATAGLFLGLTGLLLLTSVPDFRVVGGIIVAVTAVWCYRSLRTLIRGVNNLRGRRIVRGVIVDQAQRWWSNASGDPYPLYYVGVDDGSSVTLVGWEVPEETYLTLAPGTVVEAAVAGDGRHLSAIVRRPGPSTVYPQGTVGRLDPDQ